MSFHISDIQFSSLDSSYDSKDQLVEGVKIWAKILNFYLAKEKSEIDRVVLNCVRGGRLVNKTQRTIKCDCPFRITGRRQKEDGKWKAMLTNSYHNHPPINPISIPQGRQLTADQKLEVCRLHDSLVAPRQIVSLLGLSHLVKTEDIYNTIKCNKRRKLNGRSPLHFLLDSFQKENCFHNYTYDNDNQLTRLFFAFPAQITMFNKFSSVVMADCTYKTNRYKMPLLHMIGLSSVGKSFSIAFCF